MEMENATYLLRGHILDSKRVLVPAKMFWVFEKENVHPKEARALRLVLMYYWDKIAHYSDVQELKLTSEESMDYYYAECRALDNKENAFINDIYNIWRMMRATALNTDFGYYDINKRDACDVYDLMMSQLRSVVNNQEITRFDWYYRDDYYDEANKVIKIISDLQYKNHNAILAQWPYKGAIAYYWNLEFNRLVTDFKDFEAEISGEYKMFKQKYEQYNDTDFVDFHIVNINQNYATLKTLIAPKDIEFIKDVLYALRDKKFF